MTRKLHIDVFFEFICPWCLIGKRQLQAALQQFKRTHTDVDVIVHWHGVQLIRQLPIDGVPFQAFYQERLGNSENVERRQAQVQHAAQAVGVEIDFSKIKRMPNTVKAHRLFAGVQELATPEQQEQLLERLFAAYFQRCEDLTESTVLFQIAAECGFSQPQLALDLNAAEQVFHSANTGGHGVPYFIFDGRLALAGAHPAHVLCDSMFEALATQGWPA